MKTNMRLTIGFLICLGSLCVCGTAAEPSVRPVGIQVVVGKPQEKNSAPIFRNQKSVRLALLLDSGGRRIIEFLDEASALSLLQDDKGKDLDGSLAPAPKIAESRDLMLLVIQGNKKPTTGSASVRAKGSVRLRVGGGESKRSPLIPLRMNQRVKVTDDLEFEVQGMSKLHQKDYPFSVTLGIGHDIPEVGTLRFFDKKGKEIKSEIDSDRRLSFAGKVKITKSFKLAREVKEFHLEVELLDDVEELDVPFDVTVGTGGAG